MVEPVVERLVAVAAACAAPGRGARAISSSLRRADVSLAVASDIETDTQVQPADTMCFSYAAVLADLTQTEEPSCTYTAGSYHGGKCECVCPGGGGKPPCARSVR